MPSGESAASPAASWATGRSSQRDTPVEADTPQSAVADESHPDRVPVPTADSRPGACPKAGSQPPGSRTTSGRTCARSGPPATWGSVNRARGVTARPTRPTTAATPAKVRAQRPCCRRRPRAHSWSGSAARAGACAASLSSRSATSPAGADMRAPRVGGQPHTSTRHEGAIRRSAEPGFLRPARRARPPRGRRTRPAGCPAACRPRSGGSSHAAGGRRAVAPSRSSRSGRCRSPTW